MLFALRKIVEPVRYDKNEQRMDIFVPRWRQVILLPRKNIGNYYQDFNINSGLSQFVNFLAPI